MVEGDKKAVVSCNGFKEEVDLLDISAGGMRVAFPKAVDIGTSVSGEFQLLPNVGPYFVKGKVNSSKETEGAWEVAVQFDSISTVPLGA